MGEREIRITGMGGQGVVLSAYIIGHACSVVAGKDVSLIQRFGSGAPGLVRSASAIPWRVRGRSQRRNALRAARPASTSGVPSVLPSSTPTTSAVDRAAAGGGAGKS